MLVDPQLDGGAIWRREARPGSSVLVAVQIGEGCVELQVAEAPSIPEVKVCAVDGRRAGWEVTRIVREDAGRSAEAEDAVAKPAASW